MIGGKAQLLDPGDPASAMAPARRPARSAPSISCSAPRDAASTSRVVSPTFESNVPGLYIAGELGGMGLIANAIEQGRQAMEAIAAPRPSRTTRPLRRDCRWRRPRRHRGKPRRQAERPALPDARAGHARRHRRPLSPRQDRHDAPRRSAALRQNALRRVRKERLLALWQSVIARPALEIQQGVRVERITPHRLGLRVARPRPVPPAPPLFCSRPDAAVRRVGSACPARLCRKSSTASTIRRNIAVSMCIVVGGGDSALEAVIALSRRRVASLTLVLSRRRADAAKASQSRNGSMTVLENRQREAMLVAAQFARSSLIASPSTRRPSPRPAQRRRDHLRGRHFCRHHCLPISASRSSANSAPHDRPSGGHLVTEY